MKKSIIREASLLLRIVCVLITGLLLLPVFFRNGTSAAVGTKPAHYRMAEQFEMAMTNAVSKAMGGALAVEKVYWLDDQDIVAPEPNPECYGEASDPAELDWLIQEAEGLLDGQELLFSTVQEIGSGSRIKYYLDETILAITWRETVGKTEYTFSEVKIAHPSQFRRFLSGGEYGSGILYTTTEMAESVNAVTAASGDYYAYRPFGNIVYNGMVKRAGDKLLDTCYVNSEGDLRFTYKGDLVQREDIERFVEENDIRFSLAFGPLMIDNGEIKAKYSYSIGEVGDSYSRAALCQHGRLHYIMVAANRRGMPVPVFAEYLQSRGIKTAYTMDGGQTASIVTGDELMNNVDYGGEREISDIIYFATALPNGG